MSLFDFLGLLLIAGLCGWIAKWLTGEKLGGMVASIAIGFVGALIGMWIKRGLELPAILPVQIGDTRFPVVWAVIGAALFVFVLSVLRKKR